MLQSYLAIYLVLGLPVGLLLWAVLVAAKKRDKDKTTSSRLSDHIEQSESLKRAPWRET